MLADIQKCEPRTPWSAKNESTAYEMGAPVDGEEEVCYFLTLRKPEISLVNETAKKCLTVNYTGETLPHFVEWKSRASGDYAMGLEPCTTELDDRFTYCRIGAKESIVFGVSLSVKSL